MENHEDKIMWRMAERHVKTGNWNDVRVEYKNVLREYQGAKALQRARRRAILNSLKD